jgi:hypothetical protein
MVTATDGKNNFRKVWRKGNYAIDFAGNTDTSPGVISDLASCAIVSSSSGSARRKQRQADNNRYPP